VPKSYSPDLRDGRRLGGGRSLTAWCGGLCRRVGFLCREPDEELANAGKPGSETGRRDAKLGPHRTFLLDRVAEKNDITMRNWRPSLLPQVSRPTPPRSHAGSFATATVSRKHCWPANRTGPTSTRRARNGRTSRQTDLMRMLLGFSGPR
jgi:hypothetical protein